MKLSVMDEDQLNMCVKSCLRDIFSIEEDFEISWHGQDYEGTQVFLVEEIGGYLDYLTITYEYQVHWLLEQMKQSKEEE